jgi:hypothetical protein
MSRKMERTEQATFLGCEHDKENGASGRITASSRVGGKCASEGDDPDSARAIVIGAMPNFSTAHAVMIVVRANENCFCFKLRVTALEKSHDVIANAFGGRRIAEMEKDTRVGKGA